MSEVTIKGKARPYNSASQALMPLIHCTHTLTLLGPHADSGGRGETIKDDQGVSVDRERDKKVSPNPEQCQDYCNP